MEGSFQYELHLYDVDIPIIQAPTIDYTVEENYSWNYKNS